MKTQLLLLMAFALIIFLGIGLNPTYADNTNSISIQNISVQPYVVKVGGSFTVTATLVNNSTVPIVVETGKCSIEDIQVPFFTVMFDNHAKIKAKNINCAGVGWSQILDPGKKITGTSPDYTLTYNAAEPGNANVTVKFLYLMKNQTDPTQTNIEQTMSKSFQFLIHDVNETYAQKPPAYFAPPLQQIKAGVSAQSVKCGVNFILVIKSENGNPACVKPETAKKLVSLNWGIISQIQNKQVVLEENPSSANNNFAFAFFSKISNQNANIFFSPHSISDAFSMAYEGAKGNTAKQLQSVFGFIQDDSTRKNNIKSQNEQLISTDKYQLNTANAWWVQNNYPILPSYTDTLQNYYKAQITNLDLKNDSENSRKTINMWVENKTNQKIVDLLPPGSINYQIRAVLTNAVYFKANWTSQFTPEDTSDQNFTTGQSTHVKVPMMSQFATFPYYEDNTVQVLDMPYKGDRLSMIIILPKDNIQSLSSISNEQFKNWNDKLTDTPVKVYVPKFKIDTKYTLNDILDSMGIKDAFDPNTADFSGITGNHDLSISAAVHKAYVKVDEQGTEAAAATGIVFQTTSMPLIQHTFRADHPFVFMIYDKPTNLVLFLGKVTDPTA